MKPGTLAHARLVLAAGFIVDEADPRWSRRVIDALAAREEHQMSERFPGPLTPVRWFWGHTDEHTETAARAELAAAGLL